MHWIMSADGATAINLDRFATVYDTQTQHGFDLVGWATGEDDTVLIGHFDSREAAWKWAKDHVLEPGSLRPSVRCEATKCHWNIDLACSASSIRLTLPLVECQTFISREEAQRRLREAAGR